MGMLSEMDKEFTKSKRDTAKSIDKAEAGFARTKRQIFKGRKAKKK